MTTEGAVRAWTLVDVGWGRRAVEFVTLNEPANCPGLFRATSRLSLAIYVPRGTLDHMAWEWVAPVITGAVGASGAFFTWLTARQARDHL